jgi:signal transduction histidine kinase
MAVEDVSQSTILLVDDKAANLLALRAVLEPSGHRLVEARSGEEALCFLLKERCDLVLLDVQMPGLDGFETADLILQRPATGHIPIVFIAAIQREEESILKGYAHGAIDYLVKPFDPNVLRAKVDALLAFRAAGERRTRRENDRKTEQERAFLLDREREARQRAEGAQRKAEEATRLKDEFLAVLSHELRTPLTSILGWTRMLRLGKADPSANGPALTTIERNARLQATMIDDLLDVQLIDAGKLQPRFVDLDFAAVVQGAFEGLQPTAEAKSIRLLYSVTAEGKVPVFGDPDRLHQIVSQLLVNAIKFTDRNGRVHVQLWTDDDDAMLVVRDDGQGIEEAFLPHVFEPFRQQSSGLSRDRGGLGIGLAIVRQLVELHGGTISAVSEGRGCGSSFILSLPRRERAIAPLAPPVGPSRDQAGTWLSGLRVLVVEDDLDSQLLIVTMLEQFGARVTAAGSAAEGAEAIAAHVFDVILSDISMPGEDGYAFIRRIRTTYPSRTVPAAALTAHTRSEDRLRALEAGFDAHIPKPVEPSELAAVLAQLAGLRSGSGGAPGEYAPHAE